MAASQNDNIRTEHKHTNLLIHETSPYLLQHAHNPVDWYPWSDEAWNKAKEENKLVIVSIGYSACHWCHVMERESFEDEAVAKLMNENYICIKVDREERPDVDQLYMDAVQIMTGRGGWPLNAFALPDGRPVYAGTYFPKSSWMGLLHEIGNGYKFRTKQYLEYAEKLVNGIRGLNPVAAPVEDKELTDDALKQVFVSFMQHFDSVNGGNGRAPKFPMPDNYNFLLRYHHATGDAQALEHVKLTLEKMAKGGIYDQVGGGFARYSTDAEWKVPHFEKMLYDNAQLLSLYAEAYQLTKLPLYKKVVSQTITWLQREMYSPEGAFFSALDADSEGEEGKFYVWKKEEIEEVLGEDAAFFIHYYGVGKSGYWEHGNNILVAAEDMEKLAPRYAYTPEQAFEKLARTEQILLKEREKRTRPGLDDKILTSWNALAIKGLLDAYKVFKNKEYFELARKTLLFLQHNAKTDNRLYHTIKSGKANIPGFLEDYAFYIQALIHFYHATFEEEYLQEAKEMLELTLKEFYDGESGYFYFTSSQNNELVSRKIELSDNVIASPNSVMAHNLFILGKLYEEKDYTAKARRMLSGMLENITAYGPYYANWAALMLYFKNDFYELAITGKDAIEKRLEIENYFIPNKIALGCTKPENCTLPLLEGKYKDGRTMLYPCIEGTCGLPEENAENAVKQMLLKASFQLESGKTPGSGTSV